MLLTFWQITFLSVYWINFQFYLVRQFGNILLNFLLSLLKLIVLNNSQRIEIVYLFSFKIVDKNAEMSSNLFFIGRHKKDHNIELVFILQFRNFLILFYYRILKTFHNFGGNRFIKILRKLLFCQSFKFFLFFLKIIIIIRTFQILQKRPLINRVVIALPLINLLINNIFFFVINLFLNRLLQKLINLLQFLLFLLRLLLHLHLFLFFFFLILTHYSKIFFIILTFSSNIFLHFCRFF